MSTHAAAHEPDTGAARLAALEQLLHDRMAAATAARREPPAPYRGPRERPRG